jgi:hypothetical protein
MNTRVVTLSVLSIVAVNGALVASAKPSPKQTKAQKDAVVTAAVVKGRLVARGYKAPPDPDPPRPRYYWELENGFKEATPDRISPDRELAVVLLSDGAAKEESNVEVAFSGGSLMPSTIVVRPNTTLQIRNQDEIGHELYATDLPVFSAEAISPRGVRTVRLTATGKWPLRDRLVAHVRGYLYVIADLAAVAKVSTDGEFVFSQIAPGKYRLKVFYGPHELVERAVQIDAQEQVALDPVPLAGPAKAN